MEVKAKKCKGCGELFKPRFSTTEKHCSLNCFKQEDKTKKNNPSKRIKQVSDKRKIENLKYSVLRIEYLSKIENQKCPINGKPTTDIHHKKGRIGSLLLDTRYWVALSRESHIFVENNPEWAKENGYSLNRLT